MKRKTIYQINTIVVCRDRNPRGYTVGFYQRFYLMVKVGNYFCCDVFSFVSVGVFFFFDNSLGRESKLGPTNILRGKTHFNFISTIEFETL